MVTEDEIASHICIEPTQIDTLLYYLEYHTTIRNKQIIQRAENVSHIWEMRFITDNQQHSASQHDPGEIAHQLLTIFQEVEQFHLSTTQNTKLDLNELVQYLNQHSKKANKRFELNEVEKGLIDLINAHYLVRATRGQLSLRLEHEDRVFILDHIKNEIILLLKKISAQQAFYHGDKISVDIDEMVDKYGLNAIQKHHYTRFLFTFSQKSKEDEQLFKFFKRDIHHHKSDHYSLQLKEPANETKMIQKVERIFAGLHQTLNRIAYFETKPDAFDPLCIAPTYNDLQRLQRHLLWLEMFDLLSYTCDIALGQARKIKFLQEKGAAEDLHVNLGSLYLQEAYKEKKLSLMKTYAETSQKERESLFKRYFLGILPLLEEYHIPAYLTPGQQDAVQQNEQHYLVEGLAGSGKTTVLLERIKYLLYYLHVPAKRIIVLTHSKSAQWIILTMIEANTLYDDDEQLPEILTLNAFASHIFKDHYNLLKRNDGKTYYDKDKPLKLFNKAPQEFRKDKEQDWLRKSFHYVTSDEKVLENKTAKDCLYAIRCFREAGLFPNSHPQEDESASALSKMTKNDDVAFYYAIYVAYLKLMAEDGWYTYDDQVLFALALLHNYPHLQNRYSHYKHVVIDEFQDVTEAEGKLIHLLAHRNHSIFALGDSKQAIRPTTNQPTSCMQKFEQIIDGEPHVIHLTDNFRAVSEELRTFLQEVQSKTVSESIMEAYNQQRESIVVCEHSAHLPARAYNPKEINLTLLGSMLDTVVAKHRDPMLSTDGSTALIVAYSDWIKDCKTYLRDRYQYSFVILENTHYQNPSIEHILLYFRLILHKNNNDHMRQFMHFHLRPRLSTQQVRLLKDITAEKKLSWFDILCHEEYSKQLFSPGQRKTIQPHVALIQNFSSISLVEDVWQAIEKLEQSPIGSSDDQEENFDFRQKVRKELQGLTVKQALDHVNKHVSSVQKQGIKHPLILTTIDNAKSQEFDTVFLLGADALRSKERFYVSISRAKQRLFLLVDAQSIQNHRYITSNNVNGTSNTIYPSEDDLFKDDPFDSPFG